MCARARAIVCVGGGCHFCFIYIYFLLFVSLLFVAMFFLFLFMWGGGGGGAWGLNDPDTPLITQFNFDLFTIYYIILNAYTCRSSISLILCSHSE